MYISIDRFEGELAVVITEKGDIYNIPRALVPDAKEGSVINIYIDKERTEKQKDEVQSLIDELFID